MPPLAVKVTELPGQILGAVGVMEAVGRGFTVTVADAFELQPNELVTLTLYVVVVVGVGVIDCVVAPVLHTYELAGLAVKVVEFPLQILADDGEMLATGTGLTATCTLSLTTQVPFVTVAR